MPAPKPEQHRITLHGREFHFVAYEGTPANERRGVPAVPPMWYVMSGGKRHQVMEYLIGQSIEETERALQGWAEKNAFAPTTERAARPQARKQPADLPRDDWWSSR